MGILDQLSSERGDRTEGSNLRVAELCLGNPALLAEVAAGLCSNKAAMVGDGAEVMTEVARSRPEEVSRYADRLVPLLEHKQTRVRWEATHALALVAPLVPTVLAGALARLEQRIREDSSVIVRDYAVDALGNYARVGPGAAREVYPILKEALHLWEGKHAHHAWAGLGNVALVCPEAAGDLRDLAVKAQDDRRAAVRKAAKAFLRTVQRSSGSS